MRTFSVYDMSTGLFTGARYSVRCNDVEGFLRANTPEGCWTLEGIFDHRSQRLDLQTLKVVSDPQLAAYHAELERVTQEKARANARIRDLESKQHRRVRELLGDDPRLKAIDDEIATLRAKL